MTTKKLNFWAAKNCSYELTAVTTASTRSMQTQTRQKLSMELEEWVGSPSLS